MILPGAHLPLHFASGWKIDELTPGAAEQIALEAAKQCGRGTFQGCTRLFLLRGAAPDADGRTADLCYEGGGESLEKIFKKHTAGAIAVCVGSEGGFSPEELSLRRMPASTPQRLAHAFCAPKPPFVCAFGHLVPAGIPLKSLFCFLAHRARDKCNFFYIFVDIFESCVKINIGNIYAAIIVCILNKSVDKWRSADANLQYEAQGPRAAWCALAEAENPGDLFSKLRQRWEYCVPTAKPVVSKPLRRKKNVPQAQHPRARAVLPPVFHHAQRGAYGIKCLDTIYRQAVKRKTRLAVMGVYEGVQRGLPFPQP
jgi:hypothetical protein